MVKDVCLEPEFPELPVPENLREALQLRLTMHTLGMERYTGHFDLCYADAIEERVPDALEINQVVDNTRKTDDSILIALANRMTYLTSFQANSQEDVSYAKLLASNKKYKRIVEAVDEEEVNAMSRRDPELA